ncbi:MAG: polysaccharide deacetylase family protein [Burkholderiaceae bacterium]
MSLPPSQVTVLMYHAIDDAGAPSADAHYTVSQPSFAAHLRAIRAAGKQGLSVLKLLDGLASNPAVAITFDDGLVSNFDAAGMLAAVGMSADFFVNPSTIEQRGFLSWPQLREMNQMGMSIQSHAMTHRYLNDLPAAELEQELRVSKDKIEQNLGTAVTLLAPPGGRMPAGLHRLAKQLGYAAICSSRVGFWKQERVDDANGKNQEALEIPRLAVLAGTSDSQFGRWINSSQRELLILQSRGLVLNAAKRAIGNQRYERLRQTLIGEVAQ